MDINERIERFERLVADDPENDMAHFSLAGAYAQAERFADAAASYVRCTEVNPAMSKAYQLAGSSLIEAGDTISAAEILTAGYKVASEHGDLMPKRAIGELLTRLKMPIPEVKQDAAPPPSAGDFTCKRTGRLGHKLDRAPFRSAVGAWIQERLSAETWREWIALGTKIINELRLDLSRDDHNAVYDYAMRKYIGLGDDEYRELMSEEPPEVAAEYREVIDQVLSRMDDMEKYQGELHKGVG